MLSITYICLGKETCGRSLLPWVLLQLRQLLSTVAAHSCMLHALQDAVGHAAAAVASKSNSHSYPGSKGLQGAYASLCALRCCEVE